MENTIWNKIEENTMNLTKAQSKVSAYIRQNPVEASFKTLDQIAASIGTSTTTVMRFAFAMGFSGYSELQKELQEYIRSKLTPETRMIQNKENISDTSLLSKCAEKQIDNIKKTQAMLTDEAIQRSIRLIKKAKRIYLFGTRTSFTVAFFLYLSLNQQLDNCEMLPLGQELDRILNITADDLVIVVSLPRYAKISIDVIKTIRNARNASVLTITDSLTAPLAPYSDIILPCEYESLSFHNSMAAPLYIAEILITELSKAAKVETRLIKNEEIMKMLNYHYY